MNIPDDQMQRCSCELSPMGFLAAAARPGVVLLSFFIVAACSDSKPSSLQSGTIELALAVSDVTGTPIAGADVELASTSASHRQFTDANGSVTFGRVAPGDWTISISAAGFETLSLGSTFGSSPRVQSWAISLDAVGADGVARAIVLGTRMVDMAEDGSTMTFEADIAVIDENSGGIESLTAADFSLVAIDCGWGGPRDCASDADGNPTGNGGQFRPDGDVMFLGLQPPPARQAYIVAVLAERSTAIDDWEERGPALKAFFNALGGNDAASLASIETIDGLAVLTVHGPFTNDGSAYVAAVDQLAEPAGSPPEMMEAALDLIDLVAAADGLGAVDAERSVLVLTNWWSDYEAGAMNTMTELALNLGVHVSTIHYADFGFPEVAARTGGFAVDMDRPRHLGMVIGALDQLLAGTMPYYRMQFRVAGARNTFASGGNAKAALSVHVPTPFPSRDIFTRVDVAIP